MLSGSIAFYALLSVVPILVIALRVTGLFVDSEEIRRVVFIELERWVGAGGARTVLSLVGQVQHRDAGSLTFFGALVLIYGSTRLFSQLTRALDLLWDTPPAPRARHFGESVMRQLEKRTLAFLMVLSVGVMLFLLFVFHAALASARHFMAFGSVHLSRWVESGASVLTTAFPFSLMFRLLPRAKVTWNDALIGGSVTAVLFTLGSLLITAYVTQRDMSVYGAASAIIMLMLWVHYNAHAFFLGASFTVAHHRRRQTLVTEATE